MPRPLADRIATIRARQEQLAARLNTLSAKAKEEERKRDMKRKILVGSIVIAAIEKDAQLAAHIRTLLVSQVTLPNDREAIADLLAEATTEAEKPG